MDGSIERTCDEIIDQLALYLLTFSHHLHEILGMVVLPVEIDHLGPGLHGFFNPRLSITILDPLVIFDPSREAAILELAIDIGVANLRRAIDFHADRPVRRLHESTISEGQISSPLSISFRVSQAATAPVKLSMLE